MSGIQVEDPSLKGKMEIGRSVYSEDSINMYSKMYIHRQKVKIEKNNTL